jgi:catechol 2,3-dioxygenase-like lactoylglutathione lyase family enzyme
LSFAPAALVPELEVTDLDRSLAAYVDILGFHCQVLRPDERFAYLVRDGAHLMLEEASGPGRRFHSGPLDYPFGRGMNLQIRVSDVDALYAAVRRSDLVIRVLLEERWYRHDQVELGNRQFVVADPDGYLLRFFTALGSR